MSDLRKVTIRASLSFDVTGEHEIQLIVKRFTETVGAAAQRAFRRGDDVVISIETPDIALGEDPMLVAALTTWERPTLVTPPEPEPIASRAVCICPGASDARGVRGPHHLEACAQWAVVKGFDPDEIPF